MRGVVIGAGDRGTNAYARYLLRRPQEGRIVAVAEPDPARRAAFARDFGLAEDEVFADDEALLERPALSTFKLFWEFCNGRKSGISPKASSHNKETIGVHIFVLAKSTLTPDKICNMTSTPILIVKSFKLFAKACRASEVWRKNNISIHHPILENWIKRMSGRAIRSSMGPKDHRIFLVSLQPFLFSKHNAMDLKTIEAFVFDIIRRSKIL